MGWVLVCDQEELAATYDKLFLLQLMVELRKSLPSATLEVVRLRSTYAQAR